MRSYFVPFTLRKLLGMQAFWAALVLGSALVAQYGFKLHPCELCMYQRYPYMMVMVLGVVGVLVAARPKAAVALALTCAALFAVDATIAFYHAGVELDIFKGPDACSSTDSGAQTLEEMRAAIMNAPLVSCKQAMAHFGGLSMAAWNGLTASALAVLSLLGISYVRRTSR